MAIPQEILEVERPKNTVVYVTSSGKYGVKKRIGCKRMNGKNIPINGPTIGHIINGEYVPIKNVNISSVSPALLDFADYKLCEDLFNDMIDELLEVFSNSDAIKLYAMAILRTCNPDVKDNELQEKYENSFLSIFHPNVPLSKNTVSKFLSDLGKQLPMIYKFMQNRAKKVGIDHHLLIDGTLKNNDSTINTLSDYSYKSKIKNRNDISVLYAFDLERREPVCSLCYPGNMLDVTSYSDFIDKCSVFNVIIVADKGFPVSSIQDSLKNKENLHYLSPLRRNSTLIIEHDMYSYDGILNDEMDNIQYKKCSLKNGRFLYSYRNPKRAIKEENDYLKNRKRNNDYDNENYQKKDKSFGTVTFISDIDLTPQEAWDCYSKRWEIELVMRFYKHALEFDDTREHSTYSVYGSEFVDFLSETLTYRLLNKFKDTKLLEELTYSKILKILKRAKKVEVNNEWKLLKINPYEEKVLKKLNVLETTTEQQKRKRGRPRKIII